MGLRARMGGAGESDLRRAEAEAVGSSRLDQWDRLQRLDRRTGKGGRGHITDGCHNLPVRPHHRDRAGMQTFDQRSARQFDEDGISHVLSTCNADKDRNSLPNLSPRDLAREPRLPLYQPPREGPALNPIQWRSVLSRGKLG